MAKIPTPRSWNQIVGDMVDAFLSRFGLKSLKVGSPVLSIIEAAAQSDLRSSQDIFDLLNAQALDRATGTALDRIGRDEDLERFTESAATGTVTISDSSFDKISSKVYQGKPAPIIGSNKVYVTDATFFPATGAIYIGRGTSNYEGPLNYSSKDNNGTFWTLNLSDDTRRFHNIGESVILAQGGNRAITAGSLVQTPQGNTTDAVKFTTLFTSTIPDGEVEITGVQVSAETPGIGSNVTAKAINSFTSAPFTGAAVTNPLPFTNGLAAEDDKTFRERIKSVRQSRSKGTALAIQTAVQGIVATDENKRLASSSVVTRKGYPTTLYIDDGTGYEEVAQGVAVEPLVDSATGGEQYFQVAAARPVAKAFIASGNSAPFQLTTASKLAVRIGGTTYEHIFDEDSFRAIGNATAYEIASAINANSTLGFSAATVDSGTKVRIFAKEDTLEDIEVVEPTEGIDANLDLLFPKGRVDTMRLYKNDRLLSKDGKIASIQSKPPSVWGAFVSGVYLDMAVDGTTEVMYTFVDQDFIDAETGYTSVGRNDVASWAKVLNLKIPGITAVSANGVLELTSNVGTKARAQIAITGGTLVNPGQMFAAQTATGADNDYTLDRNTGQIRLEVPLSEGDSLSAGTVNTRAFVESDELSTTSIAAGGAKLWFATDGDAQIISTGLNSATGLSAQVQLQKSWGERVRLTADTDAFRNVRAGDWMIAWDGNVNASFRGTWRVAQAAATYVEIERQGMLTGRTDHQVMLLNDGRVLAIGGRANDGNVLRTCEVYDPATNAWTATGPMAEARADFHATTLVNGKVLVVGGYNDQIADVDARTLRTCEVYDPTPGTWSSVASLPVGEQRRLGFSCLVTSAVERFIVAGGLQTVAGTPTILNTTYRYDPVGDVWTSGQNMLAGMYEGSSVALTTSKLMCIGGGTTVGGYSTNCSTYDINANTWTSVNALAVARRGRGFAALLASGKVIAAGGRTTGGVRTNASAEFDPTGGTLWTNSTGTLNSLRAEHTITVQGNNQVLAALGDFSAGSDAETYNTSTGLWVVTSASKSTEGRMKHRAIKLGSGKVMLVGGTTLTAGPGVIASSETYDYTGNTWLAVDKLTTQPTSVGLTYNLAGSGIVFVRATSSIQQVTIPMGTNYTASNFVTSLNTQLLGSTAKTFRTNTIRVNTNTYDLSGDIAMVTADVEGTKLQIASDDSIENLSNHLAAVQSGSTQAGTPEFTSPTILAGEAGNKIVTYSLADTIKANSLLVGLRNYNDLYNSATPVYRHGHQVGFVTPVSAISSYQTTQTTDLRQSAIEWSFRDRLYVASPLAISPQDDITVVADEDTDSKRFTVPLYRKLTPVGTTYGTQNTFKDADNAAASLAIAFGLNYDFNDFAVYMASRVKTFPSDSTKTILWRYTRLGPDGDTARLRFQYPDAPTSELVVNTDAGQGKYTNISVTLPSGALKTGYTLRNTSKVGLASAAGPGGLTILSYVFGYSVASAERDLRLKFDNLTDDFVATEVITGLLSGATAEVVTPSGPGPTGVMVITNLTGTFNPNETITGSSGGAASTDGAQFNQVTLTLTLPTTGAGALMDITNHGFSNGNGVYLNSVNANFPPGLKTITSNTSNTIAYIETGTVISGSSIGTISFDPAGEVVLTGATPTPVAVADLFRVETTSGLTPDFEGFTMRISYYGNQVIQGYIEDFTGVVPVTSPAWATVSDAASVKIYGLNAATATATQIAQKVKGFADAEDSTCPVTAKATGSGSGIVDKSTMDDTLVADNWVYLSDGVNYVKTTTSPISVAGDYQLTFKNGIAADLATSSDWANEDVRLVPLTIKNLTDWMNTLTVTGLSTVCSVDAADQAQRLQVASLTAGSEGAVQIQGGTGNGGTATVSGAASLITDMDSTTTSLVTAEKSDATGYFAGMWVAIQNDTGMPKSVIQSTTKLSTWAANGVLTLDPSPTPTPLWAYSNSGPVSSKTWQVEKQGNFICYSFNGNYPGASLPSLTGVKEGDWVWIKNAASPTANAVAVGSVNQGIFRVIRVEDGTVSNASVRAFWIENENAVEQTVEMDVAFFTFDSVMPGDTLSVSTDLWNTANKGNWVVESVGDVGNTGLSANWFTNSTSGKHILKVSVTDKVPVPVVSSPGPLGTVQYRLVQVTEASPGKLIKRIRSIIPNQANGAFVDIKFETSPGYTLISSTAGSVLTPLDKLNFDTDLALGIDGYAHTIGLIAEANRVTYGDARDPAAYPGVVAAGANLNISGPLVKRITCALNLRVRSGVSTTDVADRVRSSVASVVNKTGIGDAIAISDIINAASKVNGVIAVSVVSPTFNSENDLISVQPYEKPLVLSLEQDVLVSFAGD